MPNIQLCVCVCVCVCCVVLCGVVWCESVCVLCDVCVSRYEVLQIASVLIYQWSVDYKSFQVYHANFAPVWSVIYVSYSCMYILVYEEAT